MELEFVSGKKFCADLGITDGVLEGWRKRHWQHGKHYKVIGRQTMVNLREVNQWLNESSGNLQQESGNNEIESLSDGGKTMKKSCPARTHQTMQGILKQQRS